MMDDGDPVKVTLASADCFRVAKYQIWCEGLACGSKLKRYEIYDGEGHPFLRVIDVTDCLTRECIGICYMKLVGTDPGEKREFVIMKMSSCPCTSTIKVTFCLHCMSFPSSSN